jgi:hypothetical protein
MGNGWFATLVAISAVITTVMAYATMYMPWDVIA